MQCRLHRFEGIQTVDRLVKDATTLPSADGFIISSIFGHLMEWKLAITAQGYVVNPNCNDRELMCSTRYGRGGGQVVSMLAFYSDDPSSNPAEA